MSEEAPSSRTILVPLDLTPAGEVKIPVAEEYAVALCADVLLLHVVKPGTIDPATVVRGEAVARTYLDTVASRLRSAGVQAESILRTGAIAETIVQEAMVRNVALIVLGTNVRSALQSAVIGSVADHVAREAPCPVMFVHPRGEHRRRHQLRCFQEDAERAGVLIQRGLGLREIELARVVGSVGRCKELQPDFRPPPRRRRKQDEDRFNQMFRAWEGGAEMPPIEVNKLGFGYYVVDGHHRVAAALMRGQLEIEAHVTEYLPAGDQEAPERFAARRAFERATGLTEVGATRADTYVALLDEIEHFREQEGMPELQQAARRWFIDVYRPLWEKVRARQLSAAYFPGERSADVIARLAAWRRIQAPGADWAQALERFIAGQAGDGTGMVSSR